MIAATTDTVITKRTQSSQVTDTYVDACHTAITDAMTDSAMFVGTGYLLANPTGMNFSFNICCTITTPMAANAAACVKNSNSTLFLLLKSAEDSR